MSIFRPLLTATALAVAATTAAAQSSSHPDGRPTTAGQGSDAAMQMMDNTVFGHVLFDQLEGRTDGARAEFRWDAQGWLGTDYYKLWVKSEGLRGSDGKLDDGQHEFLYDRAITTYFDLQGGLRSDLDSRPSRQWAALGIQGLAPYFFDLEATAYASDQGHLAGRLRGSYDLLLTQRLILQPAAELNLYLKADPVRLVGTGLSDIDAGLRLRYELSRKFAPYLGLAYEGKFGQTARFSRQAGEGATGLRLVFGARTWF